MRDQEQACCRAYGDDDRGKNIVGVRPSQAFDETGSQKREKQGAQSRAADRQARGKSPVQLKPALDDADGRDIHQAAANADAGAIGSIKDA